tara:strand:+ start:238 stop:1362 length:1125 start_codon:yes stop_codon:yes gene_type:complete
MSIFSAPSFYGAADRAIYDAGNFFIPQEQYRGAFTMQTPPVTGTGGTAASTGINTVLNQGGGGGGGGNNPFNPDMNQIRTDFRPDTEFRQFQDFGNLTDADLSTADRKFMDNFPEYYGINTGIPETGIGGAINAYLKNSLFGKGLDAIKGFAESILPVNQRAILENEARGKGILTDDIGRIVAGGAYNTPEGVMAGYNLNKITDETFDKRIDKISKTLGEGGKYGISAQDIQGLIDGTLDDDDISAKYGITTNLTSQIRNIELARQNILGAQARAKEIKDFREAQRIQEKLQKAAAKKSQAAALRAIRQQGRQDYNPNIHGGTDYGRDSSGRQSFDSGQGFGIGSDGGPVSNRTGRGRQGFMMGGLTDLVDIYD